MILAIVSLLMAAAFGCARRPAGSGHDNVTVVASFYPVWEVASRIVGDVASVTNLTPAGVEPHDLELTSRQLDQIIDADLVLYFGKGFQAALEDAVERAKGTVVDLLDGIELREGEDGGHDEEHGGEGEAPEEAEHEGEEEHAADPHVWLDPVIWTDVTKRIEDVLVEAAPSDAEAIHKRAREYRRTLSDLDESFERALAECDVRTFVTSHAAFGYLAERYDLDQQAIAGVSPEAEPSPKRLADLADLVKNEGISMIFTEELVSPEVAETLAREADVDTAVLDPIEGLSDDGEDYDSVMRKNLSALRAALRCR